MKKYLTEMVRDLFIIEQLVKNYDEIDVRFFLDLLRFGGEKGFALEAYLDLQ